MDPPQLLQQLAAPPPHGLFYNYAATAVQLDHRTALYYCANASSQAFSDHIFFRLAEGGSGACLASCAEQHLALRPSEGAWQWDSRHVCDPEVIKGRFWLGRTEYMFCMFYTGKSMEDGDDCNGNQIGAALALNLQDVLAGRWVKLAHPVVRFDGDKKQCWGVGQPSATTVSVFDDAADDWKVRCLQFRSAARLPRCIHAMQVLLFYTQGDEEGTRIQRALLTFRRNDVDVCSPNIDISCCGRVPTLGLTVPLHNAAWAYAPADRVAGGPYFYIAREGQPMPASHPTFISDHIQVARIPAHAIWDSATETSWEHVHSFGPRESGKPRNHNAGLVRDVWGMVPESGCLDVLWSVADADADAVVDRVEWSYRMCCSRLLLRTHEAAAESAGAVATSAFVQELVRRGIRMVVFDFDGVILREHAPGCGLDLSCSPGPHPLSEGFFDLALELLSKHIGMAVVTNNDQKNILPVIISNWRWHQRPERHSDFITIADSGVFKNVQCWDTHHGKMHDGQRMPSGNTDAYKRLASASVEKNGRIRLAIHRAKMSGALSHEETAADEGVGARCTLLIDDRENNVRAFLRVGGHAYLHPKPHEGLSNEFVISQLFAPQLLDAGSEVAEERRSAVTASEVCNWDWWLAEWLRTPEGGAEEQGS